MTTRLGEAIVVGRRIVFWAAFAHVLSGVGTGSVSPAKAQPLPLQPRPQLERPKALSLSQQPTVRKQLDGTAFFVDGAGHMLTARHAVEDCVRILVTKERWRLDARLVATSPRFDLALIKAPRTLGLSAIFPRSVAIAANDMVFAASYAALGGLQARGGVLANSRVVSSFGGSEIGHLVIDSPVGFGASGAPVLDGKGLIQGVVSRRTLVNRVLAVDAAQAKSFLAAHQVRIGEDDRPQLAGTASRAHRAASISARITCFQE
jgi:S1-C subfamily serine protease